MSWASGVTIVAMGALLYPALKQDGYGENFSLGLVTTSGSLGLLLPPSLPLILYGIIAQQMDAGADVSIEKLFVAGILPALLMIILLSAWSIRVNRQNPLPLTRFSVKNCLSALRAAAWEVPLMLPVAMAYGIHPVHLGIIFLANMQIGYFTPPVGMNLFIAGYRFNKPIMTIYRATIPFMLVLLLAVLIITYWPGLSLFLIS